MLIHRTKCATIRANVNLLEFWHFCLITFSFISSFLFFLPTWLDLPLQRKAGFLVASHIRAASFFPFWDLNFGLLSPTSTAELSLLRSHYIACCCSPSLNHTRTAINRRYELIICRVVCSVFTSPLSISSAHSEPRRGDAKKTGTVHDRDRKAFEFQPETDKRNVSSFKMTQTVAESSF